MRSILSLLALCLAGNVCFSQKASDSTRWEKEIAKFEQTDRAMPPAKGGIVFIGSSSIRMWESLAADFPEHQVINRGFGGSQIADSTHFAERVVFPYEPRQIVMYAGGNDINNKRAPEDVTADFRAFVEKVRTRLPQTQIAFISIAGNPARWAQVERVRKANELIAAYARETPGVEFIDIFPHMLGEDGLPRPELFLPDRLHMTAEGYKVWTKIVRPFLNPAAR